MCRSTCLSEAADRWEPPLAEDLLSLGLQAGHESTLFLVESLREAKTAERLAGEAALADVALECHNESKAAKRRVIELLAGAPARYVSALACSATETASWTGRPEPVVGWGALPPLAAGGAVDVAAAMQTAPAPAGMAETFWQGLGLQCFRVSDGTGWVRARIVCALVNEAALPWSTACRRRPILIPPCPWAPIILVIRSPGATGSGST